MACAVVGIGRCSVSARKCRYLGDLSNFGVPLCRMNRIKIKLPFNGQYCYTLF